MQWSWAFVFRETYLSTISACYGWDNTAHCSVELTVRGNQEAFAKLKEALKDWVRPYKRLPQTDRTSRGGMHPPRHPKDDKVWEQRQREIRDILRTLGPTDLEAHVREAAESGGDEFLSAVMDSRIPFRRATSRLID